MLAALVLMPLAVAEFLIGLVGNGVLMVWSFGEWTRKVKGSSYNLIVLGLAGCRLLLQCLLMLDLILLRFFQDNYELRLINVLWALINQCSLWFATLLSVFYCNRITTFKHPAYLWLKQKAYSLSLWCFLGHLVINCILTALSLRSSSLLHGNSSSPCPHSSWHHRSVFQLTTASWFPFMLFLVSSGMLVFSLYRHHRKMHIHMAGRRDAQAQAHITALKSLGCFFVLHLVYMVASSFSITSKYSAADLTRILISETFMAAYPSLHSVMLLMRIPRMKQTCQRTLGGTVCVWRTWSS